MRFRVATAILISGVCASALSGAPFTPGNLVLTRVGDEEFTVKLTPGNAAPVYLVEIDPSDGSIVQEIKVPAVELEAAGNNHRLTLSTDLRSGILTRSDNGLYLHFGGYDADPGTLEVARTLATDVKRVIARVDASGAIDTVTALSDCYFGPASQAAFRGVASADGTGFWLTGRDGSGDSSFARVRYAAYASSTSVALNNGEPRDPRVVNVYNGRLYVSHNVNGSGNGQYRGVGTSTNSPLPTAALSDVFNRLPGYAAPEGTETISQYDFVMFDMNDDDGVLDTLYVADDRTPNSFGGIEKFELVEDLWTYRYTLRAGLPQFSPGIRTVTGRRNDEGQIELFAVTAVDTIGSKLVKVTDLGCQPSGVDPCEEEFVTLAESPTDNVYRGVRFAPRPCEGDECIGACCTTEGCAPATAATCQGVFQGIGSTCAISGCPLVCNVPFADSDADSDVDLDDFGAFQRCFTGPAGTVDGDCRCFDRPEEGFPAGDGDVDQADFDAFINCASRAAVPSGC
jgi:hypothetical protein